LAEIEGNRDFYDAVRFDDVSFQISPEGQALQAKFIESYAEQLRDRIDDRIVLTAGQPVARPSISGQTSVRARAQFGEGTQASVPQADPASVQDEVLRAQSAGRQRVGSSRSRLEAVTKEAKGASAEAADDVKEW
jgi:conjugal transfer mating pair stabilization protein TraG